MKRNCEGYCGGKYTVSELTAVGADGERMCFQCADKARRNLYMDTRPT